MVFITLDDGGVDMKNGWILAFFVGLILVPIPAYCQGVSEYGGAQAQSSGLSPAVFGGKKHKSTKEATKRSYASILKAREAAKQADLARNKAVDQYMQYGCEFESKNNWSDAERSFKYVLQVISLRDGPGSVKSVPALEHLVTVTKAQNKLDDAINYQETVAAFKKAENPSNPNAVVQAQSNLADLLIQNNDYRGAVSVLQQAVSYCKSHPSLSAQDKRAVRSSYAQVLHKLHRDNEAQSMEDANAEEQKLDNDKYKVKAAEEKSALPIEATPTPLGQQKH